MERKSLGIGSAMPTEALRRISQPGIGDQFRKLITRPQRGERGRDTKKVFLREGSSTAPPSVGDVQSYLFRIAVLGDARVGKTCLIERFVDGVFNPHTHSTVEDTYEVHYTIKDEDATRITLHLLDTPAEMSNDMAAAYYRRADGFIVCWAADNAASLALMQSLTGDIRRAQHEAPIALVETRCDMHIGESEASEAAQAFCEKMQLQLFRLSALRETNVAHPFVHITRQLSAQPPQYRKNKKD